MLTNRNSSLSNLFIIATLSSSVVCPSYGETESYSTPEYQANFNRHAYLPDWKDNAFNKPLDYAFHNKDVNKIDTIISFTQNLIENSKDIEDEFVDIVNDNFWDLI